MKIEDMQVNKSLVSRIEAVRQLGAQFMERRQGDRLGLMLLHQFPLLLECIDRFERFE